MYQTELFIGEHRRWNKYMGSGAYGRVYTSENGAGDPNWVVKYATNDGTRTYLEWVMLKRAKGEFMKGMPLIDWLVPVGENQYMVAMKRYACARDLLKYHGNPDYIVALAKAFERETGVHANDAHYGNIMGGNWRKPARLDDLVLTDPSSSPYTPLGETTSSYYFELEAQ